MSIHNSDGPQVGGVGVVHFVMILALGKEMHDVSLLMTWKSCVYVAINALLRLCPWIWEISKTGRHLVITTDSIVLEEE